MAIKSGAKLRSDMGVYMTKQCGTCKWWSKDSVSKMPVLRFISPSWMVSTCNNELSPEPFMYTAETDGRDCPVYDESKS